MHMTMSSTAAVGIMVTTAPVILTQGNKAAQGLTAPQDVASVVEELVLHAGVALVAVLAVHVPAACGVLQVLWFVHTATEFVMDRAKH